MPRSRILPTLAALAVMGLTAEAHALTGREVMERTDAQSRAKDEVFESTMVLISDAGLRRERRFQSTMKAGEGTDDKVLVRFLAPPDIGGSALLTIEEGDEDTQWLYLKSLGKSKRLAGNSKAGRFMGSDLSHADMRTENLAGHDYELLGEEAVGGRACYKVKATAKSDRVREETGYGHRLLYVDKERWVVVQVDCFDDQDQPLKVITLTGWTQIGGLWRSGRIVVEHRQEGSKTIVEHDQTTRKINAGVDDATFTQRSLERE